MENSERNSLFSAFHGRKIAFSRPWFPSLGTENSIDYAKCPSQGTENSKRNSLFSVLHGRKIAFSRPWFLSLGTENNTIPSSLDLSHISSLNLFAPYLPWADTSGGMFLLLHNYCKCYLQCGANWYITRYEAIFSLSNQLGVSERGWSLQATAM